MKIYKPEKMLKFHLLKCQIKGLYKEAMSNIWIPRSA